MANEKILNSKKLVVNEIASKTKESASVVLFEYHGLSVFEMTELRKKLREIGSDLKVYKNTLAKLAFNSVDINLDEHLLGPKAIAFGTDAVAPIKVLSDYAKKHKALELKAGFVDGNVVDAAMLNKLAAIPSRQVLLTMLASGLIGTVKNLSISLDLYSKQLESK
jgi:large subunit ribosomal protein L10